MNATTLDPRRVRDLCRTGAHTGPTAGYAAGFCQANLVVVPAQVADQFERYCRENPRPCPLIERTETGDPEPRRSAPGADLRTDLPRYRYFRAAGVISEITDIVELWSDDAVGFLLGCSFTFEEAMTRAGFVPRHVEQGTNVPMYRTNRPTVPADPFRAPLVVSMRPVAPASVDEVVSITAPFVQAHGAPVHRGDPAGLGIADLGRPDFGDSVSMRADEVPLFWACGVTSQLAVLQAVDRGVVPWAISHAPGHMFITDLPASAARFEG